MAAEGFQRLAGREAFFNDEEIVAASTGFDERDRVHSFSRERIISTRSKGWLLRKRSASARCSRRRAIPENFTRLRPSNAFISTVFIIKCISSRVVFASEKSFSASAQVIS